jgi:hypothetical protein
MSRLPNDAAYWRSRAQEAQLFATQWDDQEARSAALEIAHQYQRIAKRVRMLNKDHALRDS